MAEEIRIESVPATAYTRDPLLRRTAWGAIFAGVFVALACQVLLTALGVAVGAAVADPGQAESLRNVGLGVGIWWIISAMISLFAGGLVTAWLAGFPRWVDGMLHGLVVWGLTVALSTALVTTTSAALLGGAMNTMQAAMQSPATGQIDFEEFGRRFASPEREQNIYGTQDQFAMHFDPQTRRILRDTLGERSDASPQQRQRAVNALVNNLGMSTNQAHNTVDDWLYAQGSSDRTRGGEGRLERAGEATKDFMTNAATWTFFALLLGLGAAAVGGAIGRPQYLAEDETVIRRR
jgi:hypothetical protein